MVCKSKHQPGQQRKGKCEVCEPVGAVIVGRLQIAVDVLFDLPGDGEHVILRLQEDLQRRLVRRAVCPRLEQHEAEAEMIALIHLAVHYKAVDLGMLQRRLVIGRHQNAHVGHMPPLSPLLTDVSAQKILVHIIRRPVLGVKAAGHDIGQRLYDRRQIP